MKLWLLAVAVLAAVPKALGEDASSALQAVAEMPKCAVCALDRLSTCEIGQLIFLLFACHSVSVLRRPFLNRHVN